MNSDKFNIDDLGNIKPSEEQLEQLKEMSDAYSNKSEDEIIFEIIELNKKMESEMDSQEYSGLIERIEEIRPFLDEEQIEKLDKVLKILKGE